MLNTIFLAIFPLFFLLTLGFFAGKRKLITFEASKALIVFISTFSLPAILFNSTATTPIKEFSNPSVIGAIFLGLSFLYFVSYFIFRYLLKTTSKKSSVFALVGSYPNSTFIGIPVLMKLFGDKSLTIIVLMTILSSCLLIPITIILIEGEKGKGRDIFLHIRKILLTPMIIAPFIGFIFPIANLQLPGFVHDSLDLIGMAAPGVALFVMGLRMAYSKFFLTKEVFVGIFLKNILSPIILGLFLFIFSIDKEVGRMILTISALPSATVTAIIASQYNASELECNSAAILGTLFSLLSLSGVIYIIS